MVVVIVTILIVLFIIYLMVGYNFFSMSCKRADKRMINIINNNAKSSRTKEDENYCKEYLKNYKQEDIYINSFDNTKLHGTFIKAKNEKRVVICAHGYRASAMLDFCYTIPFLLENNSSLLLIDERACFKSGGDYITFGALEKKDLAYWIKYINKKSTSNIYLYGVSLGGATVLMTLGENIPNINGVIDDCGYESVYKLFKDLCKRWFHAPFKPLMIIVNFYAKLFGHFNLYDANTECLKNNNVPILFIHGKNDDFVPAENTKENYNKTKGDKEILWIPNAKHAESAKKDKEKYQKYLISFFNKHDKR